MRARVSDFAGGADGTESIQHGTASPHDKGAQPLRDGCTRGIHLLESLVMMFVPVDHDPCSSIIERLPGTGLVRLLCHPHVG